MRSLWTMLALCLLPIVAGMWLVGCGNKDIQELLDKGAEQAKSVQEQVTKQVSGASDTVQQKLDLAGNIQLSLNPPLSKNACYVKFVPATGGRPSILQLQSYRAADQESVPSVFLQAQTTAESLAALVGQSVQAQLFVQTQADGPVWFTDSEHPVELKVTAIDDKYLTAELTSGALQSTDGTAAVGITGRFSAVLP